MKIAIYVTALLLFILVVCFISIYVFTSDDDHSSKVIDKHHLQCYFTDWAYSRKGIGKFTLDDLPNEYCTHYLYAFALYDPKENSLMPADSTVDTEFYKNLTNLKKDGKVVVLSVGGWVDSTDKYHEMLKDDQVRKTFAKNSVEYVVKHNFQGIDLDLEYPTTWQGAENANWTSDRENFVNLLKEIRKELDAKQADNKDKLYLSLAAGAGKRVLKNGYDVKSIMEVVDWMSIMTYDIHGEWESKTGLVAPLTAQPGDRPSDINVKEVIERWIKNGAIPEKLILGIPLYGKSFTLTTANSSIGSPAVGAGLAGDYTGENGTLAYYEIVDNVKNKGWNSTHIPQVGSYAYKDDQWVGYDDPKDVASKAEYVKKTNLLGAMVWAIDLDCFQKNGPCEKQYELLSSISAGFSK